MKYESFSCEFHENGSLDVGYYFEYESFSFVPIITDNLSKSNFIEPKTHENFILD